MPSVFLRNGWFSDSVRSVMAEAWQYIYSGQLLILFLLAQMAPIFFEVWMEARKNPPYSGELFFRRNKSGWTDGPWGDYRRLPGRRESCNPRYDWWSNSWHFLQSCSSFRRRWAPWDLVVRSGCGMRNFFDGGKSWRMRVIGGGGGWAPMGRFKHQLVLFFPSLHNSSSNLNQWMKGTFFFGIPSICFNLHWVLCRLHLGIWNISSFSVHPQSLNPIPAEGHWLLYHERVEIWWRHLRQMA